MGQGPTCKSTRQAQAAIAAVLLILAVLAMPAAKAAAETRQITVFAAASTTSVLQALAALYVSTGHQAPRLVFASSGVLARQIDSGAPADIYLSANLRWMQWLADRGMIAGRPVNLLSNALVLIQPSDAPIPLTLDATLPQQLAGQRLALGDPAHVPAGIYGKAALQSLGLWDSLESRIVRSPNVRAALLLVERGEAAAGIVYATDAAITDRVRVAATFPADSHPPIVYPAAVIAGNHTDAAEEFLDFLQSGQAIAIFRRYGFALD